MIRLSGYHVVLVWTTGTWVDMTAVEMERRGWLWRVP